MGKGKKLLNLLPFGVFLVVYILIMVIDVIFNVGISPSPLSTVLFHVGSAGITWFTFVQWGVPIVAAILSGLKL